MRWGKGNLIYLLKTYVSINLPSLRTTSFRFTTPLAITSLIYNPLAALTASTNSTGGSCLYPLGLFPTHFHKCSHASSSVSFVHHPNSSFALLGSAVKSNTSPALLPTTSYFSGRPTVVLNARIISKTVEPRPEPRFQARTPGWDARRWFRAARWPEARSTTWM